MNDENDEFLISIMSGDNDEARNALYEKYAFEISFLVNKYKNICQKIGVEYNDLLQEANMSFTYALNSYEEEKGSSLKTYIYLCIERRIKRLIKDHIGGKNRINLDTLSLDYEYSNEGEYTLKDILGDDSSDPLKNYTESENIKSLIQKIKLSLSPFEKEVFSYMLMDLNYQEISKILDKTPKQIDNTMQRIRLKAKDAIAKEGNE